MKPSDIERLIHICAKLNVARIKLKSGEVELSLDFASGNKDMDTITAKDDFTMRAYPIARTLGEKLATMREVEQRERQGKQPGTYMSDIDLAMNPPRDLREAMEAVPLDIVVPGEPGIQVTERENNDVTQPIDASAIPEPVY